MTEKSLTNLGPKASQLLLLSLGIGVAVYAIPGLITRTLVTDVISALLPGIVAALVWIPYSSAKPEDAGLRAGLIAGLGSMPAKLLIPPSVEWFGLAELVPEAYRALFVIMPMPFVGAVMGFLVGKIMQRIHPIVEKKPGFEQ